MAKTVTMPDIAKELENQKVRTAVLNMKLALLEYNNIIPRLRMRDYKETALKDIKRMLKEIQGTNWPADMGAQVRELEALLTKLLEPIKNEDFTRFQPVHNAVKRKFEALDDKCADLCKARK